MNYEYALKVEQASASLGIEESSVPLSVETGRVVEKPVYSGPYTAEPSAEVQILETAGRVLSENITINPIPSNYGRITWNGSVLTVS